MLYTKIDMKRNALVVWTVCIFSIGFIIGQYKNIGRIIAEDSLYSVPASASILTSTPTPTIYQTVIQSNTTVIPTAGGGPRNDIIQVGQIKSSQSVAQVGDDISFSVTIRNQAPYKKLVKQLCFNGTDGNFGCTLDFNLYPGETKNFNNSGRFTSGGVKTIWITWTQDGQNFYQPLGAGSVNVTIQN